MLLEDLPTPCILVEERRLASNLRRMQERADANRVRLRPHVKTHKSLRLAERQRREGARGITVATVAEAEVFVRGGFDDVRLAFPVAGADKLRRIAALQQTAHVSFCVDTEAGTRAASDAFAAHGVTVDVLLEVDTGHHRTGVAWDGDEGPALARLINALPGLHFAGLLTHGGHSYHRPNAGETPREALLRRGAEERDRILDLAVRLRDFGFAADRFEVSIGSTPTLSIFENVDRDGLRITEVRPGNYVFADAMQLALGSATPDDCALTVLATVVSKHRDRDGSERVFIDGGKKTFTSDTGAGTSGFGIVLYNAQTMTALPHVEFTGLSEEHGWLRVRGGSTLGVGDRVRIIPNHACVVVATQPCLYVVDGEEVIETLTVDAR